MLSGIAEINTQIEEIRADSASFEEEALRKDGEISVLEATLKHNCQTVERLTGDISTADEGNASIDLQIAQKREFIEKSAQESEKKKEEIRLIAEETQSASASN